MLAGTVPVPWLLPVAVVVPVGAVVVWLPPGPWQLLTWTALALLLCARVATAPWPGPRHPWRWVGGGLALLTLSGLLSAPTVVALLPALPFDPSVAVRLPTYLPLLVGVFRLTETAPRRPDRWAAVDAVVIVLVAVALGLLVVAGGDRSEHVPALVLPILDLAVLLAALPVMAPAARGPAQVLLLCGLVTLLLTDTVAVLGAVTGAGHRLRGRRALPGRRSCCWRWPRPTRRPRRLADAAERRAQDRREGRAAASCTPPRGGSCCWPRVSSAPCWSCCWACWAGCPTPAGWCRWRRSRCPACAAARLAVLVGDLVRHETQAQAQLRFSTAFDRLPAGLGMVELTGTGAGRLLEANASLSHLLGRPVDELLGSSVVGLVHDDDAAGALRLQLALADVAAGRPARSAVTTRLAVPGRPQFAVLDLAPLAPGSRPDAGATSWAVLQVEDVTDGWPPRPSWPGSARHDPLTGLANRHRAAGAPAPVAGSTTRPGGLPGRAALLDLDRFKLVNDTHGHAVGRRAARVTSAVRLRRLRAVDTVARLGGDEFALLARPPGPQTGPAAAAPARCPRAHVVAEPRAGVVVSASIGRGARPASRPRAHAPDAEGLIRQADIAMYRAKAQRPAPARRVRRGAPGRGRHPARQSSASCAAR